MNKKKPFTILLITILILSIIPFSFLSFPSVSAYVGVVSDPVQLNDSVGGATGAYTIGTAYNRKWIEIGDYIYTIPYLWLTSADSVLAYPRYTDDGGETFGSAGDGYPGGNRDGGGTQADWLDIVYDDDEKILHVALMHSTSSSFPYYVKYSRCSASGGTITIDDTMTLDTGDYRPMFTGITLMNHIPVVVTSWRDANYTVSVYFGDASEPTSFTHVTKDAQGPFGNVLFFPQPHAVNSTHVLVLCERMGTASLYGFYASASGVGDWIEIIDENISTLADGNSYHASVVSSISENIIDTSAYAETIVIAYVNSSKFVKCAFFDVVTDTITSTEVIADDSASAYPPGYVTIAQDDTTYYVGYVGNRANYTSVTYYICERVSGTWSSNTIKSQTSSEHKITGFDMSRILIQDKLWVTYMKDGELDLYVIQVDVDYVWNEDVTISNMDSSANWVIAEEDYYKFVAQYGHMDASGDAADYIDTVKIAFYDGFNWCNATYDVQEEEFSVEDGIEIFSLRDGGITETGLYLNVTFEIYLYDQVVDKLDVDIYMYCNDTAGNEDAWEIQATDYFNIYHLGGFPSLITTGYGGKTVGGDIFEIWAGREGYSEIFAEEFEDDDFGMWNVFQPNATLENNYVKLSDELAATSGWGEGDQSLKFYDNSNSTSAIWRSFASIDSGMIYLQTYFFPLYASEAFSIILTNMSEGATGGPFVTFDEDGAKYYASNTTHRLELGTYAGGIWKNLTIAANITAQTYAVYMNGVLKTPADFGFNATRLTLDTVLYITYEGAPDFSGHSECWIDHLRLWRDSPYGASEGMAQQILEFKKLQHFHTQFALGLPYAVNGLNDVDYGFLEWGIDYKIDDTWINNAWKLKLTLVSASVQGARLAVEAANYVKIKVQWYERNTTLISTDYFYTFWEGGPGGLGSSVGQADYMRFYVDLWFNKVNASSTIGGRISSYYYGMDDKAHSWFQWLSGSDWKIMGSEKAQSMYFADLEDASGVIHSCKEITAMRVRVKISRTADESYMWRLSDFDAFDFVTAPGVMTGVNTPAAVPTAIPTMPQGGLFATLLAGFADLVKHLQVSAALLGLWDVFVDFLDTVFSWAGWPNGFSTVVSWIASFLTFVVESASTLLTMLTQLFSMVTGPLVDFLSILGGFITRTVQVLNGMVDQITAAYNDDVLPLTPAIVPILALIGIMIPFWELERMQEKEGMATLFEDLNNFFNVMSFFVGLFFAVITFVLDLVSSLIEKIPVIE